MVKCWFVMSEIVGSSPIPGAIKNINVYLNDNIKI